MALGFNATLRNTRLNAITSLIDAVASGVINIYNGTRPATGGAVTTLLATLTMNATSFPAAASGAMTANAITGDASADATGTATWFRITDSGGAFVMDGNVGVSGSDLNLSSVSLTVGILVDITSFVLTEGNA